jgi:hypothetical protein
MYWINIIFVLLIGFCFGNAFQCLLRDNFGKTKEQTELLTYIKEIISNAQEIIKDEEDNGNQGSEDWSNAWEVIHLLEEVKKLLK